MPKVVNQDCLEGMKELPSQSVDLIVTDPPYEERDMVYRFQEFFRLLKPTGSMYVFGDKNVVARDWFAQMWFVSRDWSVEFLCWYYKNSPKPKGRWRMSMQAVIYVFKEESTWNEDCARVEYQPATKKLHGRIRPSSGRMKESKAYDTSKGALPRDVIEHPALLGHLSKERVGHPDQKPIGLIEKLILASSNEGELVLDAFGGSGTTAMACINTKRDYILFERDPVWYDSILKEIESVKEVET